MAIQNEGQALPAQHEAHNSTHASADLGSDFVLIAEGKPPPRIALARERMLICRLYVGLLQTITDDYGAEFAAHSDSLAYRTIGIYIFLRTTMCSPARASQIAHALRLPRAAVLRRLQELVKHGYVERVGNAYRVTDKVNIPDLQNKLQRRIDMVTETARKLSKLGYESSVEEESTRKGTAPIRPLLGTVEFKADQLGLFRRDRRVSNRDR